MFQDPTEEERRRKCEAWIVPDEEHEGQVFCRECNAKYRKVQNILHHIEAKHIRVKAYACQYCAMTFYSKHIKIDHISRKHRAENKMAKALKLK